MLSDISFNSVTPVSSHSFPKEPFSGSPALLSDLPMLFLLLPIPYLLCFCIPRGIQRCGANNHVTFPPDLVLSPGQTNLQVDTSSGLALNLHFIWPPTCIDLHRLALTLVELKFGCKLFTISPHSTS